MGQLDGKTALVTGGTSGIGLATARRFAEEGAHVFLTGRRQAQLDEAVDAVGSSATGIRSDVTDEADLDRVFETVTAHGAGLDVLFANAGGGEFGALGEITREHFADTFDRNVGGTLFTVQKVLPLLNPGASIVLTGSTSATNGTPAFSVYAASKAAIRSFGRTWAAELAGRGIRVNTLVPGSTETPGLVGLAPDAAAAGAMLEGMAAGIPLGRVGRPEEIANAALFLASDQSSFMTGGEIFVDGGSEQI
jgi:NAD(P)-dependent dehydrogenase (short-subunit alcohol dehydrogenase family)